jgi:hypothetical protein
VVFSFLSAERVVLNCELSKLIIFQQKEMWNQNSFKIGKCGNTAATFHYVGSHITGPVVQGRGAGAGRGDGREVMSDYLLKPVLLS